MPAELTIVETTTELEHTITDVILEQTITDVILESSSAPGPAGPGVPAGGSDGQVLTKTSGADYATAWENPTGGVVAERAVQILVSDPLGSAITTGDGKAVFLITDDLDGLDLVDADAALTTASSSGTPTVQVRRMRAGSPVDTLSTRITIDENETSSYTAATAPVIDGGADDVATGDLIHVDIDVAGTGAKGLIAALTFG